MLSVININLKTISDGPGETFRSLWFVCSSTHYDVDRNSSIQKLSILKQPNLEINAVKSRKHVLGGREEVRS